MTSKSSLNQAPALSLLALQSNALLQNNQVQQASSTQVNQARRPGVSREMLMRVLDEALRILDEDDDQDLFGSAYPAFSRHGQGTGGAPFAQ